MSLFGVASKGNCYSDLFYGTDYQSHKSQEYGGLAFLINNGKNIGKKIRDIGETQFKAKFSEFEGKINSKYGIGVISPKDEQPITLDGKVANLAICTEGRIDNIDQLSRELKDKGVSFNEKTDGENNTTEVVANLINQGNNIVDGIQKMYAKIDGSISLLLLTKEGIYASGDRFPLFIGEKDDAIAITSETCAFPNLGYKLVYNLQPREIVKINDNGSEIKTKGSKIKQICAFLWIYFGFPGSSYEGILVEITRYNCGAALARRDSVRAAMVGGIPNSGTPSAIGYANETINMAQEKSKKEIERFEKGDINLNELKQELEEAFDSITRFKRGIVKYDPGYNRSFTPKEEKKRKLIAKYKLIPILRLLDEKSHKNIIVMEDSIVRGNQLEEYQKRLLYIAEIEGIKLGAIDIRSTCPPLIWPCKFSFYTKDIKELAARKAIRALEGKDIENVSEYLDSKSKKYEKMVEYIREKLEVNSLMYQRLDDMVKAIGLPREDLCLYCWNGEEVPPSVKK